MKSKKIILIVYLKLRMGSIASKELMYNTIVKDLRDQGREIVKSFANVDSTTTVFDDGTKVDLIPFGQKLKGARVTHLYIDDTILALANGNHFVKERLLPLVISGENYTDFDVEGSSNERVKSFNSVNNLLKIYDYE